MENENGQTPDQTTNQIENTKPKKVKKTKTVKLTKKVPGFYRKKYTAKTLEKKIYKKIFIPADKQFVKSLIQQVGTKGKKEIPIFSVPKETLVSKKDFKRLKLLAKQIKKQKGRFKVLPFAAVVIFIAGVISIFTATKNILIKKGIQAACEKIFEAKCDIGRVNFKFLDASLRINQLEIANKNEPMKDLIYIDSIALDFDLTQACRARFVADELSVLGVETGRDRTYDGSLSKSKKAKIEKKKKKEQITADSKTSKDNSKPSLADEISSKLGDAKANSMDAITGMFDQYNPETIIQNCYNSLKTPDTVEKISSEIPKMISYWEDKPAQMEQSIKQAQASFEDLINFDYGSIQGDPQTVAAKVTEMIQKIQTASKEAEKLKNETTELFNSIASDSQKVANLSSEINNAIKDDTNFAQSEINKIMSFNLDTGMSIITDSLSGVMYSTLGKYYPYYEMLSAQLANMKANSATKKDAKAAKSAKKKHKRAPGQNITYRRDTVPSFWIKKAAGSGPNFIAEAFDISSDMNKLGKPATAVADVSYAKLEHHADIIVDTRDSTENPLVTADYSCANIPFFLSSDTFGGGPGTPSFDAVTKLRGILKVFEDDGFTLSGDGDFKQLKITTVPFEPEFASTIYSNVMGRINEMQIGVEAGYKDSDGLILSLDSDVDRQFGAALVKEMNSQLNAIKDQAISELTKKLQELSKEALGDIGDFNAISSQISGYTKQANKLSDQLEAKRKEGENYMKKQAEDAAKAAADEAKKQAESAAKDAIGNMFKGFGF